MKGGNTETRNSPWRLYTKFQTMKHNKRSNKYKRNNETRCVNIVSVGK